MEDGRKSNSVVKLLLLFYILEAIRRQALQSGSSKSSKWVFLRAFFLKKLDPDMSFQKKMLHYLSYKFLETLQHIKN